MSDTPNQPGLDQRARELRDEVLSLPFDRRAAYLDEQCGINLVLRRRVEALMGLTLDSSAADAMPQSSDTGPHASSGTNIRPAGPPSHAPVHGQDRSSVATPTLDPSTAGADAGNKSILVDVDGPAGTAPPRAEQYEPQKIGQYRMLEVIGEGGFGTVWVAEQVGPVRRRVALKIIKPGMDSRTVIARFEQERQALAIMDHANIAKVFDAGTALDGRPYFVMEYVAGEPVTNFCDRNKMNVRQRLELFLCVCDAIQHAHHKGIIHRDIKPSNVLVTGTYSPPGAGGVTAPSAAGQAAGHAGAPSVGAGSGSVHGAVVKVIDFGVAKAVSHVLTDKTLFTEHGQILGTPEYMSPEQAEMGALDIDTRTDVYALGVLLYELLVGALPFEPQDLRSRGYNEIQRIIREVDPPRPSTRLRSLAGERSADIAKRRQMRMEELEGQLRRELEWIPLKAMRKDREERYPTPAALADDIRNHLAGRPLVAGPETVIYRTKKFVYRNRWGVMAASLILLAVLVGAVVSAIGFVRAARNAELARKSAELARANADQAKREADRANVEARKQRALNDFNRTMLQNASASRGERKDVTVRELLDKAAQELDSGAQPDKRIEASLRGGLGLSYLSLSEWSAAERQYRRAIEIESASTEGDTPELADYLTGLGQVLIDTNRLDDAEKHLKDALNLRRELLGPDDVLTGNTVNMMGMLELQRGNLQEAKRRFADAIVIFEKSPMARANLGDAMTNLAGALHRLGDSDAALDLGTRALALRREVTAGDHIDVWYSLMALASVYESRDDFGRALKLRREAMEMAARILDEKNRRSLQGASALARTMWLSGDPSVLDEAERLQARAVQLSIELDGADSLGVAQGTDLLACIARDRGQLDRAVELFRGELAMRGRLQPSDHPDVAATMSLLADALNRRGNPADSGEAVELAKGALAIRTRVFPEGHWAIWNTTSVLGAAYAATGDSARGERMLLEAYKGLEAGSNLGKRPRREAALRLASYYEKTGKMDQAGKWRETAASLAPKPVPASQSSHP